MAKELKVTTLAEKLADVRANIAEMKEKTLAPLEELEASLSEQLLKELGITGLGTIRYNGYNYIRAHKTSFKITNQEQALEWAKQYPAVIKTSVDTTKATKILSREVETPAGFERQDTEFLSVRKAEGDTNSDSE